MSSSMLDEEMVDEANMQLVCGGIEYSKDQPEIACLQETVLVNNLTLIYSFT